MQAYSPLTTLVEIFYPEGFTHDYEWTARTRGFEYYAVWNDTAMQHPNLPSVNIPEEFQGNTIPVYGPFVAYIIEEKINRARSLMKTRGS